jgi:hypothetical protein
VGAGAFARPPGAPNSLIRIGYHDFRYALPALKWARNPVSSNHK